MQPDRLTPPPGHVPFDESQMPWPEIDASLLEDARGPVPVFPLSVLPTEWARWVSDSAEAAGAPVDYVAQGLLGAVAAVCGAGVMARVSSSWAEPLVLWQALVGTPSSGKSPALAAVRQQLGAIEDQVREGDGERRNRHYANAEQARLRNDQWREACAEAIAERCTPPERPADATFDEPFVPSQIVVADATLEALADVVSGNPRGVILWRDELAAWLANLGRYANGGSDRAHWLEAWAAAGITINRRSRSQPLHLRKFPVSLIGSIQPDRIAEALQGGDDGMAARFLFAWPDPAPYRPLGERSIARDDDALARLQVIANLAGTAEQPLYLPFDSLALELFDRFLAHLHGRTENVEGLEGGWLGKGRGTVARLAAILTLLRWSEGPLQGAPQAIEVDTLGAAADLWSGYFTPHARAVFNRAGRTDRDRHARRALRWLRQMKVSEISREDLRRDAFYQSLDAQETDRVVSRLVEANVLRLAPQRRGGPGRPARRWQVHPAVRA
jgi:hypothetical protein